MRTDLLVLSAADLSNNDGYIGHLRLVTDLLAQSGVRLRVVGFSSGAPLIGPATITSRSGGLASLAWTALCFVLLLALVRPRAALITSAGAPFNPLIAMIARLLHVPILYDCQDPPIEGVERFYGASKFYPLLERYLIWGMQAIDKAAVETLSVSPGLDEMLRRRGWTGRIARFYNVHNAIDTTGSGFSPRRHFGWASEPVLVYVGGLQPRLRGLEEQISAIRRLNGDGIPFKLLLIYGSGSPDFIYDAASDLIESNIVRLLYNLSPRDVFACLSEADVAISAALPYALPSKIFEYIAAGTRVVSRDSDRDIADLFGDFLITYDGSIEGMVRALDIAKEERGAAASRAESGRRFVNHLLDDNRAAIEQFCALMRT